MLDARLTLIKDLLVPSIVSLPFQIRPNLGIICLSIRIRPPHESMVSSMGGFPVPYGLGTGLIEGME